MSSDRARGLRLAVNSFRRVEALAQLSRTMNGVVFDLTTGVADVAARLPDAERDELLELIRTAQATMTAADDQLGAAMREVPEGAADE